MLFKYSHLIQSDERYLKLLYFLTFGKWLDFDKPESFHNFNEKIQWLKLKNYDPIYTTMADKYAMKQYVSERLGNGYTFPLLGCWSHFDEIDFSKLPDQFVLKPTHCSGSVVLCRDKHSFDYQSAKTTLEKALSYNYYLRGRERPYKDIPRKIIAEPLMVDESGTELKDYKFFCFNGEVKLIQVDFDRFTNHRRNLYTPDWKLVDASILYPNDFGRKIEIPEVLDQMIACASILSKGIPFVRVDFYIIRNRFYLGEFTFYHGGGLERIRPRKFSDQLGSWIVLSDNEGKVEQA